MVILLIFLSGTNPTAANGSSTSNAPNTGAARRPTLMEELVWMIGGGRPPAGAMTAGAPFVLVGTPGDYVFGGDGTMPHMFLCTSFVM